MELTKEDYQGYLKLQEQNLKQNLMTNYALTELIEKLKRKVRKTKSGIKKK